MANGLCLSAYIISHQALKSPAQKQKQIKLHPHMETAEGAQTVSERKKHKNKHEHISSNTGEIGCFDPMYL